MPNLDILIGDNLEILPKLKSGSVDLIYIDPPFNTGKTQQRTQIRTVASTDGDRVGFKGKRYKTIKIGTLGYVDIFNDYIEFLEPRIKEAHRLLSHNGSLFFHIDCRESHYCKLLLDIIFGRENFMNEIIWSYDYGARSKRKWSCKHDNIFWYTKNPKNYIYNYEAIDRVPYMAPGLVEEEKAKRGKTPTDVWWHTIVSPNGREKTGYATQKPRKILERIIKVHSNPDSLVGDFFAGSGSFGAAAYVCNRDCFLVDKNKEAIDTMKKRFHGLDIKWHENASKDPYIKLQKDFQNTPSNGEYDEYDDIDTCSENTQTDALSSCDLSATNKLNATELMEVMSHVTRKEIRELHSKKTRKGNKNAQ